jgi:two-component system nitrate/nitrite response regulator NarL
MKHKKKPRGCFSLNILIADHQPLIRRGIMEILSNTKESYNVFEAGTLAEAIKIILAQNVDIAFVDLHLGADDGLELVDKVRQVGQENTKFILMATTISIFEFRRAKELSVDGYILKDAMIEDILYAFNVVKRGEKFYQSKIIEKAFSGVESERML